MLGTFFYIVYAEIKDVFAILAVKSAFSLWAALYRIEDQLVDKG